MTERLTGLDASFLYVETPTLPMHVMLTVVFRPQSLPGRYSFPLLRSRIEGRLTASVFRRRLVEVPLHLGRPVWVVDPDFDIDNHLHQSALPAPGGIRELAEFTADIASRPLNRDRPLWEMWLVEGLEDGNTALVAKMHHSTMDGVTGAQVLGVLFDLEPDAPDLTETESFEVNSLLDGSDHTSDLELVGRAMASGFAVPFLLARTIWQTGQSILRVRRVRKNEGTDKGALPLTAPRTSFNGWASGRRRVAYAACNLADVKHLKSALGVTVNDVVIAIATGALRAYLEAAHELPEIPLVSVVPVSVTPDMADLKGSNKISGMFVGLPTNEVDPLKRLSIIHQGTKLAKNEHNALGAATLQNLAELANPIVFPLAARLYEGRHLAEFHRPIANLLLSNVPGPDFPLFFGGSEMVAGFPLGPVIDGIGLNITIMSYRGVLYWGLISSARLVPNIWSLAEAIPLALAELLHAADIDPENLDVPLCQSNQATPAPT